MNVSYDPVVDALFMSFGDAPSHESEEVKPGVILDFDADGHIVAKEILDVSHQLPASAIAKLQAAE